MKVVMLAASAPNWPAITDFYAEVLDFSPARALDEKNVSLNDLGSTMFALGMRDEPCRPWAPETRHVYYTFGIVGNAKILHHLINEGFQVHVKINSHGDYAIIATANFDKWSNFCTSDQPGYIVEIATTITQLLSNSQFYKNMLI